MSAIDWQKLAQHRRAAWMIAGVILLASLAGVFTIPILDRDEARFAQATAQMLETGDFVEIRFLDDARNKKPVGIHWLQAASVWLTSSETAREIWAYRLPSVLGALLAALAVALLHTLAMTAAGGVLAWGVYRWLGLKFLSKSWFNLDIVWALSLILVGLVSLLAVL